MKKNFFLFLAVGVFSLANKPAAADGPAVPEAVQDNVLIDLSGMLINAAVERNIDQTDNIREVALGNPIFGTARTRGQVGAVLVPDASNGVVDVLIRGSIVCDTVAVPPEKGLLVYSTAISPFTVAK